MREGLKCWRTHNLTPKDTNSWLVLEPRISRITQIFFCKDFFYHKFPQIIFSLNLVESVWAFGENQRRASVRFSTHKESLWDLCDLCEPKSTNSANRVVNVRCYFAAFFVAVLRVVALRVVFLAATRRTDDFEAFASSATISRQSARVSSLASLPFGIL